MIHRRVPFVDLTPNPISQGRARALLRPAGALSPTETVVLVTPTGLAPVLDPSAELRSIAANRPLGCNLHVSVRAQDRGQVRLTHGFVEAEVLPGGSSEPDPATGPIACAISTVDDISLRLASIAVPELREFLVSLLCAWSSDLGGIEQLPLARCASGPPYDVPGGWAERTQELLAGLERHRTDSGGMNPLSYAVAQVAAILIGRPADPRSPLDASHPDPGIEVIVRSSERVASATPRSLGGRRYQVRLLQVLSDLMSTRLTGRYVDDPISDSLRSLTGREGELLPAPLYDQVDDQGW